MALAGALDAHASIAEALDAYGQKRSAEVREMQLIARNSARWLEHLDRYIVYDSDRFALLLDHRRSSLLQRMPPAAYLQLLRAGSAMPGVTDQARRVVRRGLSLARQGASR
jgi:hypothetical protein